MTARQLLNELRARGAVVFLVHEEGNVRPRCEAPRGALTDELRQAWTEQRPAMLEMLQREVKTVPAPAPERERRSALDRLRALATANQSAHVMDEMMELWQEAEIETRRPLTLAGWPTRAFYPADAYDPALAVAYAHDDPSLTPEQRANLLKYAEAAKKRVVNKYDSY